MSTLVTLRVRTKLLTEEDLDEQIAYPEKDLDPKEFSLAWRKRTVPVEDIVTVTAYNLAKTLVLLETGEEVLVKEPHDQVKKKWDVARAVMLEEKHSKMEDEIDPPDEEDENDEE